MDRGVGAGGWLVGVALGAGCLLPNPGYDPPAATDSRGEGATSRGPTTGGTSSGSASSSEPSDSGGSLGASSGGLSASEATTGGSLGSGGSMVTEAGATEAGSGSSGAGTGSGGSTGAPSDYCAPELQAMQKCVPLGATKYLVCDTQTPWQAAVDTCAAMCGRLAVILADAERLAMFDALRARMTQEEIDLEMMGLSQPAQPLASLWIGGSDVDGAVGGPFLWLDGTSDPGVPGQGGWGPNDPDEAGSCMVIGVWGKMPDNGEWFDRTCTTNYRYVCDPG